MSRNSEQNILSVVGSFYEAAQQATPEAWKTVYTQLAKIYSSRVGGFALYKTNTRSFHELITTVEPELLTEFLEHYQFISPLRKRLTRLGVGDRLNRAEQVPDDIFVTTEIYRRYYSRVGIFHFELRMFHVGTDMLGAVVFSRPNGQPNFNSEDLSSMSLIVPHLERAFQLYLSTIEAKLKNGLMNEAFDRLACNVLVVDRDLSIVVANSGARKLLGRNDGLGIDRDGRLRASDAREDAALKNAAEAVLPANAGEGDRGQALLASRSSGQRQLEVVLTRFSGSHLQSANHGPLALVFVYDPDHKVEPVEAILRDMYGLTAAEARIAALLGEGEDINEICNILSITQNTARTHLKRIFSKTETSRQTELVKLIVSGPATIRAWPGEENGSGDHKKDK